MISCPQAGRLGCRWSAESWATSAALGYVEIVCYTGGQEVNGTGKWFRAQYFSSVGYLSASVVTE